jgi:hypothetical protein
MESFPLDEGVVWLTMATRTDGRVVTSDAPDSPTPQPRLRWRPIPVHPLLVASYPVAFLLSSNVAETGLRAATSPLLWTTAMALLLTTAAGMLLRDLRRGALAATVVIALGCSYGYLRDALPSGLAQGAALPAMWSLALVALALLSLRAKDRIASVTRYLNIAAAVLLAFPVVTVISAELEREEPIPALEERVEVPLADVSGRPRAPRDIYFLVFDRYGGPDVLDQIYNVGNGPFLRELEDRGFQVARSARANYPNTAHSLGATLNLGYHDALTERTEGGASPNWGLMYNHLRHNEAAEYLAYLGYRHVQVGSWWEPTRTSPFAESTPTYNQLGEFSRAYVHTTLLEGLAAHFGVFADRFDVRRVEYNRIRFQLDRVRDAVPETADEPSFVFLHALVPHAPYVFRADGTFLPARVEARRTRRQNYADQLEYTNAAILTLLDDLLDAPTGQRPIIVLQSDEGPHPLPVPGGTSGAGPAAPYWNRMTDGQLQEKFGILSAFYVPDVNEELPDDISPVNTFRLLFRLYFERDDLDLLPDRSYVWTDQQHLYEFTEVSERLDALGAHRADERRRENGWLDEFAPPTDHGERDPGS